MKKLFNLIKGRLYFFKLKSKALKGSNILKGQREQVTWDTVSRLKIKHHSVRGLEGGFNQKKLGVSTKLMGNKEKKHAEIKALLNSMVCLQNSLEPFLAAKEITWTNDLYDEITIGYLKEIPDSSYQNDLADENFAIEYIDAKRSIIDRTKKIIDDAEDELWSEKLNTFNHG